MGSGLQAWIAGQARNDNFRRHPRPWLPPQGNR
jgi:hypothetical protein